MIQQTEGTYSAEDIKRIRGRHLKNGLPKRQGVFASKEPTEIDVYHNPEHTNLCCFEGDLGNGESTGSERGNDHRPVQFTGLEFIGFARNITGD